MVTLAFFATFAGSAVAVPNVVDQYTEQLPSPTGPNTTIPKHPDSGKQLNSASGADPDSSPLDSLPATEAPLSPGAGPDALKSGGEDSGTRPRAGKSTDSDSNQADDPQGLTEAQPAAETETGGIGSGMGIVFPVMLLLVTVAAIASVFARRGAHGQAGQG